MEDESHHNNSSSSVIKKKNNSNRKRSRSSSRSRRKNNNSTNSVDAKSKGNQQQKNKKNPSSSSFQQKNNHRKRSRSRPKKKTTQSSNNSACAKKQQQQQQKDNQELLKEEEEERREAMSRPQSPMPKNNVDDFDNKFSQQQQHEEEESASASVYLRWDSPADLVPLHEEEAMMKMVLERHGKSERGMLKDKPPFVITKFRKQLSQKAPTMTMAQLCSLRRHHIKRLNFYKRMSELRLGQENDILKSAMIFEDVIQTFLNNQQVEFWSEKEQGKIASSEKRPTIATPDFLLKKPVVLQKTRRKNDNGDGEKCKRNRSRSHRHDHHGHGGGNNRPNSNQQQQGKLQQQNRPLKKEHEQEVVVLEGQTIHWIEAKMFYGASTIPRGKKGGAVGQVLDKAQKYVEMFGTGAIVFMMGCGQVLGDQLREIGVTVVDCSSHEDFDLRPVHDHQRTWCANDEGEILP